MKLRRIVEQDEYTGLEDADVFGSSWYTVWIGGGHWGQITEYGKYSHLDSAILSAKSLSGPVSISYDNEEVWNNNVGMYTESEYAGLEDADEFGDNVEFMGEAHLGPHIFRVWYHKNLDRLAVEVNGYEFGFGDDHMPIAQKDAIVKKFIELRPDLLPHIRDNSPNGRIMEIGLALVQN